MQQQQQQTKVPHTMPIVIKQMQQINHKSIEIYMNEILQVTQCYSQNECQATRTSRQFVCCAMRSGGSELKTNIAGSPYKLHYRIWLRRHSEYLLQ